MSLWLLFLAAALLPSACSQNVNIVITAKEESGLTTLDCVVAADDDEVEERTLISPLGDAVYYGTAEVYKNDSSLWGVWTCDVRLAGVKTLLSATALLSPPENATDFVDDAEYRLPEAFVADSYEVTVLVQAKNDTFEGDTSMRLIAQQSGSQVTFHARGLTFLDLDCVRVRVADIASFRVKRMTFDLDKAFVTLHLDGTFKEGDSVEVALTYEGSLGRYEGLYKTVEELSDGTTRDFFMTQFSQLGARQMFPCLDEPGYKATFKLKVAHREGYSSLSNMPQDLTGVEVPDKPGFVMDVYRETPPMSTYLVAVVVSQYVSTEPIASETGQTFRIWSSPEEFNKTDYAAEVVPTIYDTFVRMFGQPDAVPKEDLIAVPYMRYSAMENWGLITFQTSILLPENETDVMNYTPETIAHELTHIWFGNLVTPADWSNVYLKEAFASHFGYHVGHLVAPQAKVDQAEFNYYNFVRTYYEESLEGLGPLVDKANTRRQISQMFDDNSYGKGGALVKMMKAAMGEEGFLRALRTYQKENRFGNAFESDLLDAIDAEFEMPAVTEVTTMSASVTSNHMVTYSEEEDDVGLRHFHNATFSEVMLTWTRQGGYPTIMVTRGEGKHSNLVTVEQLKEHDNTTIQNKGWWVPISYTWVGGDFSDTHARFWLDPTTAGRPVTFELEPEVPADAALVFNVEATGHYRTMYDFENLERLLAAVTADPAAIPMLSWLQIKFDLKWAPKGTREHGFKDRFEAVTLPGELPFW